MKKIKLFLAACAAMVGLSASAWDGSAGKVYLQNAASGLYWGAGDHLNWGTRAMLVDNPEYVTLSLADGVYKLESQVSNGGTAYYFNGDYMDNGSPVSLTITQSGDYWTIANGETYYGWNNNGSSTAIQDNASGLTADSDGAKWIIRTHDEMLADLASGTVDNPKDATFLFLDPGFGRNNRNVGSWTVSDDCTNKNLNGANPNNYGCGESYHSKFTISQSATVPNGVYKVSGRAFYRQDGTDNTHIPYLEANGQKSNFPLMNTGINSMQGAQESFMQGNWTIDPMIVEVTAGSLEIKMVCEQTGLWCILDGFELEYYGPITLADLPLDAAYVTSYNNALNAAKAYQSQDMFDADKTALNAVISANEFDASTKKQGELESVQTAISALNAATAAAAEAVNQYTSYNTAVTTINGGTNVDLTSIIGNPDFEVNPVQYQLVDGGWTNEGVGIQYQNNTGFDGYKSNTWFAERWVASGQIGAFKTSQTLTLPAGIYELSVVGTFNGNGASLFVGDATTPITDATTYKLLFKASDKEQVTFGVQAVSPTGTWFKADNFQLTYVGEDFPAYTLVDGKMSAAAAAAQSNAETTFNNDKTVANYNALLTAITAAQASKEAYAKAATAIADANALKENNNFATVAATTTFAGAIAAVQTKYNEGTLTDTEAAAGGNLGTVVTGWHAGNNTPAAVYLRDGFALGDFEADPALHVNTWSTEGDTDGSNFSVPFYESWTADANSLPESTVTGTISDLPNGLYKVSAWVRVAAKTGVNAADAAGITMNVNNGTAVDVTEGEVIGTTQRSIATYEAQGLVKQGQLTLNFSIAADANISWLAFKNVKYTKLRDLTEEEAFVAATAEDYAALNAAIEAGEAKTLGFDAGDYAPYNNIDALATLAAAKAIDQAAQNAQEDVQAATAALTSATWNENTEEVNGIYDGFFTIQTVPSTNTRPQGWARHSATANSNDGTDSGYETRLMTLPTGVTESNKGMMTKFHAFYGDQENFTLPLKAETYYTLSFKYAGWGNTPTMHVNVYNAEGTRIAQSGNFSSQKGDSDASKWAEYSYTFKTTAEGNYVIGLIKNTGGTEQNQAGFTDIVLKKVPTLALDEATAWTPTAYAAANVTLTRSFNTENWATFVVPFDIDNATLKAQFGDEVQVSTISADDKTGLTFTPMETPAITANEPVIMKVAQTAGSYTFENVAIKAAEPTKTIVDGVQIVGNYAGQISIPGTTGENTNSYYYIASNLLKHSTGKQSLKGFRAYFSVDADASSTVKAFFINGGDIATAVEGIEAEKVLNGNIYNLAGQRVNKTQKGLYIVNGKKVLVK